jgi:hypothetical protein
MALNNGLDASSDNVQDGKGMYEKAGKVCITHNETSHCVLNFCYVGILVNILRDEA